VLLLQQGTEGVSYLGMSWPTQIALATVTEMLANLGQSLAVLVGLYNHCWKRKIQFDWKKILKFRICVQNSSAGAEIMVGNATLELKLWSMIPCSISALALYSYAARPSISSTLVLQFWTHIINCFYAIFSSWARLCFHLPFLVVFLYMDCMNECASPLSL